MALTDTAIKQAKPASKPYTLTDGDGLSLQVPTTGSKRWHFRFYWHDKQLRISLGTYPDVSLKEARQRREAARALVANNIDPRSHRRAERQKASHAASNTFEAVSDRWHEFRSKKLTKSKKGSAGQASKYLKKDMLPCLGDLPIADISRGDVLELIRRIERRGALVSARKVRTWLNQIFRFAMAEGLIDVNPASDLDIVAETPRPVRHNPFLHVSELPGLLRTVTHHECAEKTRLGIRLLLLTGVRTGELRAATPDQFDFDKGIWLVPPEGVKQLRSRVRTQGNEIPPYVIPLSTQAIALVQRLMQLRTRGARYLLVHRYEPQEMISENTLNTAISRMGYKGRLTGHGIRATISTALNEVGFVEEWIEAQLSHADANQIRAAYNHAEYVEPRRRMMQYWADLLDALEVGVPPPAPEAYMPQIGRPSTDFLSAQRVPAD
ncbi:MULTISPECIES: tyrosine-type recombinase/integrase [Pseudomonas]|uniref:Integrase arm-type DNA-binding domain-containing protein n=1 Tax=Pseudomonas rhodesiae TaxID=76760 RepID=A0A8I1E3Z9_9PSED|nr:MULTISPECIES: integrase arm-type DNA-binding domain-containing protein [Pseudomonas]MBI6600106.1 integrase arm-type DNA-binding domain-containing protein [Pseudomonas sp. S4_EA_1b]MBI6624728.1 integrase arm-type DNA-binding domain-containing protein [Pseudomonas rhodesiae]